MEEITEIFADRDLNELAEVIRRSFRTVAEDFGLTRENAPTNPAFLEEDELRKSMERGLRMFAALERRRIIACVGIETSKEKGVYYLERLAVVPEYRHKGLGSLVMEYALDRIRQNEGSRVSIGIIDDNERLKAWYKRQGFVEKGRKTFKHLPFRVCFMDKEL